MLMRLLLTADIGLSRVDACSLSDQIILEIMVTEITDTTRFKTADGDFKAYDAWDGIVAKPGAQVEQIVWSTNLKPYFRGGGTITMTHFPPKITMFDIAWNSLEGEVVWSALPPSLRFFRAEFNKLTGTVDLTSLPPALLDFRAAGNRLEGSIDLSCLPENIRAISLNSNQLSGSVRLVGLPASLGILFLENNKFIGEVIVGEVMRYGQFNLQGNDLHVVDLEGKPWTAKNIKY